jgi:polyisoprenoid-binding protein YceI
VGRAWGCIRTYSNSRRRIKGPFPGLSGLSASDAATIDERIRDVVLHSDKHPKITFTAQGIEIDKAPWSARGTLTLHGTSRPLSAEIRSEGGRWIARIKLHQPTYGIKPFRAMLGTLKVKPDVDIVLRCTLPA